MSVKRMAIVGAVGAGVAFVAVPVLGRVVDSVFQPSVWTTMYWVFFVGFLLMLLVVAVCLGALWSRTTHRSFAPFVFTLSLWASVLFFFLMVVGSSEEDVPAELDAIYHTGVYGLLVALCVLTGSGIYLAKANRMRS